MQKPSRFLSLLLISLLIIVLGFVVYNVQQSRSGTHLQTFDVYQDTDGPNLYHADSKTTSSSYQGTLKEVVEGAVDELDLRGGGKIAFRAGVFDLGSDFFLLKEVDNIIFEGQGIDVTIIKNNSNAPNDTEPFNSGKSNDITIRNLTVSAGGSPRKTSDAIDGDDANNWLIENVKVAESRGCGIIFDGKGAGQTANDNIVRNCIIDSVPNGGIQLLASSNNLIEGCTITNIVAGKGINVNKSSTKADQPNKSSNNNIIRNNTITNTSDHGIKVNSSNRNIITGNTITNSLSTGIQIGSSNGIPCDDNVVKFNTANNNIKHGLHISHSECSQTVVWDNNDFISNGLGKIHNRGTDIIFLSGEGTKIDFLTQTFDVYQDASKPNLYHADSTTTSSSYQGTLKKVVEGAIDELDLRGGGKIAFRAGVFDLGSDFFLLKEIDNITFEGQGIDVTIVQNNSDAPQDTEPFNSTRSNNITIRNLTVSAGGSPRKTSDAIDGDAANNWLIENVKVDESRGCGIILDGKDEGQTANGNTIRNCFVDGILHHGIQLLASSNNLIEDCTITNIALGKGISVNKASTKADQPNKQSNDNTIRNNTITNTNNYGIEIHSGSRNIITGNIITNGSSSGIQIGSSNGISCDDNILEFNTANNNIKHGLDISNLKCSQTVVWDNNDFTSNGLGEINYMGTNTIFMSGGDTKMDSLIITFIKALLLCFVLLGAFAYMTVIERKLLARMQHRYGPNRVGPFGLLQPIADAIKSIFKEDIVVSQADKFVYFLAPFVSIVFALTAFGIIPAGPEGSLFGFNPWIIDLDIGLLYVFAVTSIGVYGIFLAGWASNSKYSLLGGLRSSAQMISYELGLGLSVLGIIMITGTLNLREIVEFQASAWWKPLILLQPIAFITYLVSAIAEVNRTPFDLPEAEQEIVAGYLTEYSSIKWALFQMAEYVNMMTAAAFMSTIFLGGWRGPAILGEDIANLPFVWLVLKMAIFMFLFIWLRGTLPRLRYDQLMRFGWVWLFEIALASALVTGIVLAFIF